jgi:DNA-binding response OmpR family regulator
MDGMDGPQPRSASRSGRGARGAGRGTRRQGRPGHAAAVHVGSDVWGATSRRSTPRIAGPMRRQHRASRGQVPSAVKLLLVDDDPELRRILSFGLRREGYTVVAAADGEEALRRWEAERPDLVLLDLRLPLRDGLEVCRRIRQVSDVPVIVVTGSDEEEDVVRALQYGSDDCIIKPFSVKQLVARIEAVLRRSGSAASQAAREVRVGDLVLQPDAHEVTLAGTTVQLTRLEFRILHALALSVGSVVPYHRLAGYAWGSEVGAGRDEETSTLLKTHISHIRKKLGPSVGQQSRIEAVPKTGYRLARP